MLLILYLAGILIFGWILVRLVAKKITLAEHLGLSIILGFGVHSLIFFLLKYHSPLVISNNFILLAAEIFLLLMINKFLNFKYSHIKINPQKITRLDKMLLILTVFIMVYSFIQAVYWPPYEPDAIHLYDFRAKQLLAGNSEILINRESINHNELYPPFTSLMHYFIYQTNIQNPKLFYPFMLMGFYLTVYGYAARLSKSRTKGLLTATLIIFTPSVWWNSFLALPNIPYMIFLSLAVLYMFDPLNKKSSLSGLLPAFLLGLSAWTRLEPFWIVPAGIYGIKQLFNKQIISLVLFLCLFLSISSLWPHSLKVKSLRTQIHEQITYVSVLINKPVSTDNGGKSYQRERDNQFFKMTYNSLSQAWGLIFPLFILVVICEIIFLKQPPNWMEVTALGLTCAIILGMDVFSKIYPQWAELSSSLYRMAILVIPFYWITIINSNLWNRSKLF